MGLGEGIMGWLLWTIAVTEVLTQQSQRSHARGTLLLFTSLMEVQAEA